MIDRSSAPTGIALSSRSPCINRQVFPSAASSIPRRMALAFANRGWYTLCSTSHLMIRGSAILAVLVVATAPAATVARYSARQNAGTVQLQDDAAQTSVAIVPSVGNIAFEMKVKGENVLYWPFASIDEFRSHPGMSAIPFVGPWVDRLDEPA